MFKVNNKDSKTNTSLNIFHTFFCFCVWIWTSKWDIDRNLITRISEKNVNVVTDNFYLLVHSQDTHVSYENGITWVELAYWLYLGKKSNNNGLTSQQFKVPFPDTKPSLPSIKQKLLIKF